MSIKQARSINSKATNDYFKVANGVWGMKIVFVNIYMIKAGNDDWVLVDAGLKFSGKRIRKMAAELFGPDKPPLAIILTHGHFDHRGALDELLQAWDVPVYAHRLEMPYLTGRSSYPPPDPTVGGGLMSYFSFLFPNSPINISGKIQALDERNTKLLPFLPGWQFIVTPGHAPGHISLFMEKHGILIAGDAFVTTKQESLAAVVSQKRIISGPPKYFTYDWNASKTSVEKLTALNPQVAATGHGKPVRGLKLAAGLKKLVSQFDKIAVPSHGRYVRRSPWINEKGVQYLPPPKFHLTGAIVVLTLAVATIYFTNKKVQDLIY